MAKQKITAKVISQEKIATEIYSLWLHVGEIAKAAVPGQFVSLYTNDGSKLLPRPISICEVNPEEESLRLVYRVTGEGTGTQLFSQMKAGEEIPVLGPLGNGFPVEAGDDKKVCLIGGGIGVPPMVELAKHMKQRPIIVAGYRNDELFLSEDLKKYGDFYCATEDGSAGTKGNVLDTIREEGLDFDVIFACGPTPMLRALKAYAEEKDIVCYLSLEERMACGVGACLACVCKSKEVDDHSHVHNKRVCKDGPVFLSTEVEI